MAAVIFSPLPLSLSLSLVDGSFRSHFIDTVLKMLPNVKTLITVNQSLLSTETGYLLMYTI